MAERGLLPSPAKCSAVAFLPSLALSPDLSAFAWACGGRGNLQRTHRVASFLGLYHSFWRLQYKNRGEGLEGFRT